MKTNKRHSKPTSIPNTRWAAYAAAGAATALAGSNSVEAAIHYSGILDVPFPTNSNICYSFPLDQPSHYFRLCHSTYEGYRNSGSFALRPYFFGNVRGYYRAARPYVSQLHSGRKISSGPFVASGGNLGAVYYGGGRTRDWNTAGGGFVGFSFNSGVGIQYGWARIRMGPRGDRAFILHDYAYADPGEPLRAGQISRDNDAVRENSLGGLALGAVGLLAWRKSRSRNAR